MTQLIDRILTETRMESIFASLEDGAIRTANLQSFYQLVSECETSNQKELTQFLDYLESLEEKGLTVAADQTVSDAITIMSIHKSKGLEFPVVFLCGLSRDFNREDVRAQVLCNRDLGIGLNCVDLKKRIRYPSVAKRAIAEKIIADSISEELRVLYVAMTRAKDRLIMTYAANRLDSDIADLVCRMDICDRYLLTAGVSCPGTWILLTALERMESGPLFALCDRPDSLKVSQYPWKVTVTDGDSEETVCYVQEDGGADVLDALDIQRLQTSLSFQYPHRVATTIPSKQTATQLKGRQKDQEAAENTEQPNVMHRAWRSPSFVSDSVKTGTSFGNTIHGILQYINYSSCCDLPGIRSELDRLSASGLIDPDMISGVDPQMLWNFFSSEMGKKLIQAENVLREFKFSILEDASLYASDVYEDQILLQGVVDCAIIESDGITILDFKTDQVTEETLSATVESYKVQVQTYARALSKIFHKPVLSCQLYFFRLNRFVSVM